MPEKASESEMTVLAALLERRQATAAQLHTDLARSHPWAHSTVVTFLRRLEAKNLVTHTRPKGERAFVFRPTRRARASRRRAVHDMVERLFGGNPLPLVSSLLDDVRLDRDQIRELRRMIDVHLGGKENHQ